MSPSPGRHDLKLPGVSACGKRIGNRVRQLCSGLVHVCVFSTPGGDGFQQSVFITKVLQGTKRVGENFRHTDDCNGKAPEFLFSILLKVHGIADCNSASALLQFKGSLQNREVVFHRIARIGSARCVVKKIDFAGIVSLFRVDSRYHAVRCQLNALDRVIHQIRGDLMEFEKLLVPIEDNLFQRVGDLNPALKVLKDPVRISDGINGSKAAAFFQMVFADLDYLGTEQMTSDKEKKERQDQNLGMLPKMVFLNNIIFHDISGSE